MNKARRKALEEAAGLVGNIDLDALTRAKELIEAAKDEEQEAFDNLTPGLQENDRGQAMEAAVSAMEEALEHLEAFIDNHPLIVEKIFDATGG